MRAPLYSNLETRCTSTRVTDALRAFMCYVYMLHAMYTQVLTYQLI
jgi:hypothetical protein